MPSAPTHTVEQIKVAGRNIRLLKGGDGPPLLYLHSAGGEVEWIPSHRRLARHYTLYVPVHPGFEGSDGLDTIEDFDDLVWHYIDLLDQLGLEGCPVVGFSLGAWIAVEVAIRQPRRFSHLVLVSAAGLHVDGAPMGDLFASDMAQLRQTIFAEPNGFVALTLLPDQPDPKRVLGTLQAREATARVAWNPYLHNPKLGRHLHRVQCPTLMIWGRDDHLIPLACGEAYARAIPGAKLKVFDHCGHMVPFEKTEEFVAETVAFLKS